MSERRKSHRSSGIFKAFAPSVHYPRDTNPLEAPESLERWTNLAHGMSSLAQNIQQLSQIHKSLGNNFNESFASFLYGLLITMFCNNFPESPNKESYEHKSIIGLSSRIETLQDRVRMAKAKNQQLRAEVERRRERPEARIRAQSREARFETPTRTRARNPLFQSRKQAVRGQAIQPQTQKQNHGQSAFSHNQKRTPLALGSEKSASRITVAHDDTYTSNDSFLETPSENPNLNQAPRYMQGLFDKTGTANVRRPPANKPNRVTKPRGLAAQRAQRARESRLKTRPPFR